MFKVNIRNTRTSCEICSKGLLGNRSTPWQNVFLEKWYFTTSLSIRNPLGAFKDIQISAKFVEHTPLIKFSDTIDSA